MKYRITPHPDLDFCHTIMGGKEIPTKQDKFKPIPHAKIQELDETTKELLNEYDLYVKKKGKSSIQEFEKSIREKLTEVKLEDQPYPKSIPVEAIISVSMNAKRLKQVDVDNLAKSVLDCCNGIIFEDDSQVQNLLVQKNVNEFAPLNGLTIAFRKLDKKQTWFNFYIWKVEPIKEEE